MTTRVCHSERSEESASDESKTLIPPTANNVKARAETVNNRLQMLHASA